MSVDIDYVIANGCINRLQIILNELDYGERELICDDIVEFTELMILKYGKDNLKL